MSKSYEMALEEIKVVFLERLQEQKKEFEVFLEACKAESASSESLESIRDVSHKIAGSGGTFGFEKISALASEIEVSLIKDKPTDFVKLTQLVETLLNEVNNAFKHKPAVMEKTRDHNTLGREKARDLKKKALKTYSLLVVDDDVLVQQMIERVLDDKNIDVVFSNNGNEALTRLEKDTFDLIILDMNMPELNGLETLTAIKKMDTVANVPVVMLTRRDDNKSILDCLKKGAVDYILKPFNAAMFVKRIVKILKAQSTKILIADDDELIRVLLKQKFERSGYSVILAENGEEVLPLAQAHKPVMIIMDIMMPARDGLSVLKELKDEGELSDIPVILLTAKKQRENILIGLESGAHDYIVKPFDVDELAARVDGILQRQSGV